MYGSCMAHTFRSGLVHLANMILQISILPYAYISLSIPSFELPALCTALSVGGTTVLNANFQVTSSSDFSAAGVKWKYRRSSTAETLSASGTLTEAATVEVLVCNGVRFTYEYTLDYLTIQTPTARPSTTQPPTTQPPTTQPPTTQPPTTRASTSEPFTTTQMTTSTVTKVFLATNQPFGEQSANDCVMLCHVMHR